VKVPQVGTVEIGDDVEIGCNCTVDRATMDKTIIENGVKIDNHSHIAHNCRIGENSMLIAYARMGGSTILGKNVLLAEDVGLTDGITLGDRCIVGACSKVSRSWPADSVILGAPAQLAQDEKRQIVMVKKLGRLYEMVREMRKTLKGKAEPD
jgi:UDP-3-O-[3-hydroxymyristoyl] glucosamine N-acyltransferase